MNHLAKAIEKGDICPHCGEESVESSGAADFNGNICSLPVYCLDCNKEWIEKYKMYSIEVEDE